MQQQPGLSESLRLRPKLPEVPLWILLEAGDIKQHLIEANFSALSSDLFEWAKRFC
jgi:hypothetical protein